MKRTIFAVFALGALLAGAAAARPVTATTPGHAGLTVMHITMQPQAFSGVTGSATVTYNPSTRMTTVKVTVYHLEPGSSHPSHIHAGKCSSNGPVLVVLTTVKANTRGTGVATTTFKGSMAHKAAYINVHMGPGLGLTQYTVLSCGELAM